MSSRSSILRRRNIPSNPVLSLADIFGKPLSSNDHHFPSSPVEYTGFARWALYRGLQLLGIQPGENVLVPRFMCNVILAPFTELGIEVRFYDVNEELNILINSCNKVVDCKTRALVSVNYFGFPQNYDVVKAYCNDQNLYLIEDNAHGFLSNISGRKLGSFGDISIFSMRKTVAIPNGAALVINCPIKDYSVNSADQGIASSFEIPLKFLARNLLQSCEMISNISFVNNLRQRTRYLGPIKADADIIEENNLNGYRSKIDPLSISILKRVDVQKIVKTRRSSYMQWHEYLSGMSHIEPVRECLPEGVCPFAFAVRGDYLQLAKELYGQGVECYTWPTFPSSVLNDSRYAKLLLIPLFRKLYE